MTPIGILKTVTQIALFDFDVKLSLGTHFFVQCKKHHFDKVCVYGEANNLLHRNQDTQKLHKMLTNVAQQ